MSQVTVIWSGAAAAALLLGIVSISVWILDRRQHASLAFAAMSFSLGGVAITEMAMMMAASPADWVHWVRWCHLPLFVHIVAIAVFVRLYLGTGRLWLMWTIIAMRGCILLGNFIAETNFNFVRVDSVQRIRFLGDQITVLSEGVVNPWQWFATLSVALLLLFVIDASITLWRSRITDARRKAIVIGGSVVAFALLTSIGTQLVIWGVVKMPMLITPPFIFLLTVMAIEMSRDVLRAGALARNLRESENRLALAAASVELGLWTWDTRRNRIWATERARTLLDFGPDDDITFEQLHTRVHEEDFPRVEEALRMSVDSRVNYNLQFRTRVPNSAPRWLASQGTVDYDDKGRILLIHGVLRDVSNQKKSQEEADELRREVAHVGRVTMLGQLAAALAHELNQPLSAILRNAEAAEILLATPSPDLVELRAIVGDILKDDRRAGDIIDRLRALLKRKQMQFLPLSIESLIKDTSTLLRADAAARHVALEYTADDALPVVAGDRVHLSQVLINLILNGMDAVSESSDTRRRISVAARSVDNTRVEIAVVDSGPGIATTTLARIFDPFFTTKAGGMGMGLAVSRTIVEAHGGQLSAENAVAGGAIFRMMLPVAEPVS